MRHVSGDNQTNKRDRALQLSGAPELGIVIPTFNEADNVPVVVDRIRQCLSGIDWEILFVDDNSPDDTAAIAKEIGRTDARVRCNRRIGRRGLAGACIEGMLASQAPYLAVMDADLQHDETLLPAMLEVLRGCKVDLVIGSRYLSVGDTGGLSPRRHFISQISNKLANRFTDISLTDPMSGFFMIRRDAFEPLAPELSTYGFKILLDIAATARGKLRISELPYSFTARHAGERKLDLRNALDFIDLLVARMFRNAIPSRFVSFLLVGFSGVGVHLITLRLGLGFEFSFPAAQTIATLVAMTSNFFLNNKLTYRDQQLKGFAAVKGLVLFYLVCSMGAVSNIGVAS